MSTVCFQGVSKQYPTGAPAVVDLDLAVDDGELLVVVGPSGCGKSTTLRMLAGLEDISGGTITIDDRVVNDVPARDRDIAMVFQSYALYPHLTVGGNLSYPLKLAGMDKAEREQRVRDVAKQLRLTDFIDRKPRQLSGGQRQRVAMGRAMVRQPSVFLMDEPLSNLDAKLRVAMRAEVSELQRSLGTTMFYVTHDQVEAMTMGDRVAVMDGGVLRQVATPHELYARPANVFVAGFIGSPPMNRIEATVVTGVDGSVTVTSGTRQVTIGAEAAAAAPALVVAGNQGARSVVLGIRPEHTYLVDDDAAGVHQGDGSIDGTVRLVELLGSEQVVHVDVPGLVHHDLELDRQDVDAALGRRIVVTTRDERVLRVGDGVRLKLKPGHLHVFDGDTGDALRV